MRRLAVCFAALAWAPVAAGAPPAVSVHASVLSGASPLQVTLTASGDAAAYRWDFGDGASAEGPTAVHSYGTWRFVAVLTATSASGETAQVRTTVSSYSLTLRVPAAATWNEPVRLTGRLTPRRRDGQISVYRGTERVSTARLSLKGTFRVTTRLRDGGPYHARFESVLSSRRSIVVRPVLSASVQGPAVVGKPLTLSARLQPAAAGTLRVRVLRDGKETFSGPYRKPIALAASRPGSLRVSVSSIPARGFAAARASVKATVVSPTLSLGSRGASVRALEQRLWELRFALKGIDGLYAGDTYEAVLAFQKLNGLARTGRVDAALWRRLRAASTPRPRYGGGTHIEVDKRRQLLFEIAGGRVARIVHVSTGATGNTPLGRWSVYRKVGGWDWVLWYPMYFRGGFAIHGYPSVPAYPASHGCVRIPMWFAPGLYSRHGYGAAIYVYY